MRAPYAGRNAPPGTFPTLTPRIALKVIPTRYRGILFRSRLEARWAVFFDKLGIRNLYEPEPYKLEDGTCYTPDFFLPAFGGKHGTFAEVRPDGDPFTEPRKLARETEALVWLCEGEPDYRTYTVLQRFTLPLSDCGTIVTDVTEEDAVPCIGKARGKHRFFWVPAFEFSEDCARGAGEHEYIVAVEAARSRRFWNPQQEAR